MPTVLVIAAACGPGRRGAATPEPAVEISPRPRAIQIANDSVTLEGAWSSVGEVDGASSPANTVTTTCVRATRRCREELTTARVGASPLTESFDYRIEEWTKARLVAVRRDGSGDVQIRVALTGQAASKTLTTGKGKNVIELRWRLE